MARAILVSFNDNDAAEAFVKTTWQMQESDNAVADPFVAAVLAAHGHIEWMVAVPRNYCRCVGGGRNHKKGWSKTKRFGWWVHEGCNRVSYLVMKNFMTNMLNGHRDILTELAVKEVENEEASSTVPSPVHANSGAVPSLVVDVSGGEVRTGDAEGTTYQFVGDANDMQRSPDENADPASGPSSGAVPVTTVNPSANLEHGGWLTD